jgi:branched-chain amino acid transport system substrate-binding protein
MRSRQLAAFVVMVAVLAACGSDGKKGNSNSAAARTTAPTAAVSLDYALNYTGGKAGRADSSLKPITIGYVNQEDAVPSFPEASVGIKTAVRFVNEKLRGVDGHALKLSTCIVRSEEDGQRCGTQMANDDQVSFVIVGVLAVGGKALYSTLEGKKPVIIGSISGTDDLFAKDAFSFASGGPGVLAAMATFISTRLSDVHKVAVVYADNPGGRAATEGFLKPLLQKAGIRDITLVPAADTATGPDLVTAIQAAGGLEADVLVPFVTLPGCIATYDALKSLAISPTVVATGLCFGKGMTQHLADLGSKDVVPNGWYFGDFGQSMFVPNERSGMATAVGVLKQYEGPDVEYTGFATPLFADLLTAVRFMNQIGAEKITADAMRKAMKSFTGPMMTIAGPMKCGFSSLFPSLCGHHAGIF